jgi:Hypothetical protein (DUF2513)
MQPQLDHKSCEMQRDMDLIRELLLKIEADPLCDGRLPQSIYVQERTLGETDYHLRLLDQAGYITGTRDMGNYLVFSLTWEGHEFLDNIKDATIWAQTKEKAKEIPGVGLKIVGEIASNLIRAHFHLP